MFGSTKQKILEEVTNLHPGKTFKEDFPHNLPLDISVTLRFVTRSATHTLPIFHEPGSLRTHIQKSDQQLSEMKVEIVEL